MKLYKDPAGTVFAYEPDGSQDAIIPADQVPITQAEADALRFPAPTLAEQQSEMWERIKAKRDELRFDGGVEIGTNWFLSTAQAVSEYTALSIIGAGAPGTTILRAAWRTMVDGVTVDMTPDLVKQILGAGFTQVAAIDDASIKHKAAMEAAADPLAYDFSGGWPATFQG